MDVPTLIIRFSLISHTTEWINKYVTLFDIFTNYLCIIMCYPLFDKYYKQICGPFDHLCKKCLSKSIGTENLKHEKNLSDMMEIDAKNLNLDDNINEKSFESNRNNIIKVGHRVNLDDITNDESQDDEFDLSKSWPSSSTFTHFGCCFCIFICKLCILIFVLIMIVYTSFIDKSL